MAAADWPGTLHGLLGPGLYAWWTDDEGAAALSHGLGVPVAPGRVYAGQAGATRWPSGRPVTATLGSRIANNHLRGRVRSSTFRRTLAAALLESLGLKLAGPARL